MRAATITWTNNAGGYWSVAANWYPNQVPGPSDTVIIPLAATNGAAVDATYIVQNLLLEGGTVATTGYSYDTLTVNGQIDWTNGVLGCVTTNNGVMTLAGANGVDYQLTQFLENAGSINLVSGNLLINDCGSAFGGLDNATNAVINFEHDANVDISQSQFGQCAAAVNNAGAIVKTGGTGTSSLYVQLNNSPSGIVDAQTGALSFDGGGTFYGTLQSEGGGALSFGTNIYGGAPLVLDGNLTSTNAFLAGASIVGTGTNNGVLTWTWGTLATGDGGLTISSRGVLVLAGTNGADYALDTGLNNLGTIRLVSGNLLVNNCGENFGALLNEPGSLVEFENDVNLDSSCGGLVVNEGIVRKSGGTGTSDIGAYFNNGAGVVDAESGTIALTNNYDLSGGTLNFGISALSSYGQVYLSGMNPLSGQISVGLENGYVPSSGNSFPLLTYGLENGAFTGASLPAWINWLTNYTASAFTLTVNNLNGSPQLTGPLVPAPGRFFFQFGGNPDASYSVIATTNLLLPLTNWTDLGSPTLVSNDLYQYVDRQATNFPQRFYMLRSP